jgi:signal transduction histidine kinase/CheY-like chemotaxis protein
MTTNLFTTDIRFENDIVLARQKARTIAAALKFDPQDQTRIATAVSEIARNTFQYGGGGRAEFRLESHPEPMLTVTLRDQGKGIRNLSEILEGRYVSRTGMGMGLVGAKRLMDYFHVETQPDQGTTVVLGKKTPSNPGRLNSKELNSALASLERASEDPYEEVKQQNKELLRTLQALRAQQEELVQLNRELDETNRGVVALYAELNDKADFLQRASELKSHFLSNMSHEFRTPLNSISALSALLLDRMDGTLTPEQEKQVRFIRNSAQELTEIVNDLLDLAKVEAGKVTMRPSFFQATGLFAALRGMLRPLLSQNSSVNLVFEDPVDLKDFHTDEAKVSQILRNFISNALKFTERGEVRVAVTTGPNDVALFSVADTGIGIAPEHQELIFQEWMQIEGKLQKRVQGTGLGLPLSRKLAQMLGGDVYVKSQPGAGSTFFAAIPFTYSGATDIVYVPDVKREIDPNKLPVLVVEDNREALFIYEKYLRGTPFQIVPANNLKEARSALSEFRPVAVVLDVLLQGEHSWDFLQDVKSNPATASIPVLVVTVVENREKAIALGADAFQAKPVDRGWLVQQLDAAVSHRPDVKKVLVIDDDEISRYLVRTFLSQTDLRIVEAFSGEQGLVSAQEAKPDAVILDLKMPDMSGFDVLRRLKADSRTSRIPVIVYTSKMLCSDDREMLADAAAILSKEGKSREVSMAQFADAFTKAGVAFAHHSNDEVKHV